MENKKNKKKLFAIIGASALAFILTVALSVSITLAYFGGSKAGNATVTMDKKVEVGTVEMGETSLANALPGQAVNLDATATVAAGASGAFLAAKVEIGAGIEGLALAVDQTFANWTKSGEYYIYTGSKGTTPQVVANEGTAKVTGSFIINKGLTNDAASTDSAAKTVTITVTFVAVQGKVFGDSGAETTPTLANVLEMVKSVVTGA